MATSRTVSATGRGWVEKEVGGDLYSIEAVSISPEPAGFTGHSDSGATAVALQAAAVRCASRRGNAAGGGVAGRSRNSNPRRSFWRASSKREAGPGPPSGPAADRGHRCATQRAPGGREPRLCALGEDRRYAGDVGRWGPCGVEDPWCGRARRSFLLAARDAPLPERWLGVESFDRPGIASRSLRPHLTRNGAGEASCH